jgi:hypothetical protein
VGEVDVQQVELHVQQIDVWVELCSRSVKPQGEKIVVGGAVAETLAGGGGAQCGCGRDADGEGEEMRRAVSLLNRASYAGNGKRNA